MKANDFVKLVFGYFADNPEAGLDFIEHIENRAELAASAQDGNVWDKRNVVKAGIIQHCGADELPIARIVDDKPGNPKKESGKRARVPKRASKKQDVDKTKSNPYSLDERMEDAYMGEHVNIEPEQPEKKAVVAKRERFLQLYPGAPRRKNAACMCGFTVVNGDVLLLKKSNKKERL